MRQMTLSALAAVALAAVGISPVFAQYRVANATYTNVLDVSDGGHQVAQGDHGQNRLPDDRGVCGTDEQARGSFPYISESRLRGPANHDMANDKAGEGSVPIDIHAKRKEMAHLLQNRAVQEHVRSDVAAARRLLRRFVKGA
jgi:hypothetical protein